MSARARLVPLAAGYVVAFLIAPGAVALPVPRIGHSSAGLTSACQRALAESLGGS